MTPPVRPPVPDFPFQLVSADHFEYAGHNYLVMVDRYSGWPTVRKCRGGTSAELITMLREFFCVFGTPEELATDGASVFVAREMQQFLELWSVRHRVSTAYAQPILCRSSLRRSTQVNSEDDRIVDVTDTYCLLTDGDVIMGGKPSKEKAIDRTSDISEGNASRRSKRVKFGPERMTMDPKSQTYTYVRSWGEGL